MARVQDPVPEDTGGYFELPLVTEDSLMHFCQINPAPEQETKVQALIRLDEDVLVWFKSRAHVLKNQGSFCQLINDALRQYASQIENQKL